MNQISSSSSLKDFEILEEIGKGAFGYVYKAKRIKDGEIYALKKVFMNKLKPKEKENSLNEIRILASISHNNVISYKEAFYDNASYSICIVMEFAENGDLERKISQNIKNKTFMTETDLVSTFVQIVLGLKALHDKKILHRDIKAANIFIFKNDIVKIGDLNVSKVNKNGLVNTQTGTPYYASPEVWNDKPYDSKSDIWSLGCLLYEMCCLKAPFRGTTMKGVYEKVMKGVYTPIPTFYSPSLSNLISIMLSHKPLNRPSCDQILAFIQEKMKNLKLTVSLSTGLTSFTTASNLNSQNNQMNQLNTNFDEIMNNSRSMNRSSTEKLLKTIKIPKKMIELNTILPKSQYKKKRINSSFNTMQKNLDINNPIKDTSNIPQTTPDLNKTEIIGISSKKKLDQDKSFNDISAYYRAQNKLIDDLLNEENDKPILDKKTRDRSLNLKPILDKDLSGIGLAANDISCIDDPILKSINKPINLKKNLMINKVRNNLSAGVVNTSDLIGNQNNSSLNAEPRKITSSVPIHKRILDLKREYVSNIVNITSPTNQVPKIVKDFPSLDEIKSTTDPIQNMSNLNKKNNYHFNNKLVIVKPQYGNSINLNVLTNDNNSNKVIPLLNNASTLASKTPLPSLNYKEISSKIRPITAVPDLIRHDRNNSVNIKRVLNQDYLPINQKLDYSANNIEIKNKDSSSIILQEPSSLPKLQKPNSKNILNLFNHNNFNSIPTKNFIPKNVYNQGPQNKKQILGSVNMNMNMNMNLYPIKLDNDVYNIDIKPGSGEKPITTNSNNPVSVNKLFTRINPKIMTPLNSMPTKLVPKEKMIRDIKIKN